MTSVNNKSSILSFTGAAPVHLSRPPASLSLIRHSQFPQPSTCRKRERHVSTLMMSESPDKKYPEDFDRDYYDELKAKYGHLDNVQIFSKDDYELDPSKTPWLGDEGNLNVDFLRKKINASPVQPGELDVAPDRPFRHTDLHTSDEIESLKSRFQKADAVSGRVWEDPMPDSDFNGDEEWVDLRKIDVDASEQSEEDVFADAFPQPRKRKQYASPEEEFAAVMASADRMQADNLDQPIPRTAWAEAIPVPDPDDFAKWERAAEERGGNSTRGESYFLSPAKKVERNSDSSLEDIEKDLSPPPQRQSTVDAHVGSWVGDLTVFSVTAGRFSVKQEKRCTVKSKTAICDDGGLEWSSAVTDDDMELVSEVVFTPIEHAEALIPGRGVSSDGSYVQNSPSRGSSERSHVYADMSIGRKFLTALTGDKYCKAELELCIVSGGGQVLRRDRVLLCTANGVGADEKKARKGAETFAYVIALSEDKVSSSEVEDDDSFTENKVATSSDALRGDWTGNGILLHPEFPPLACREVKTSFSFNAADSISEDSVTWVENELEDEPGVVSKGRRRTLGKKKVSKRVAAARAYDRKRLSECSFLSREEIGTQSKSETHAWQPRPSAEKVTCMLSPRVGKFVEDYCGVVLPGGMLVTFPLGKAFPDMWNTVTLAQGTRPVRKRISAGRNEFADLVGALFLAERVSDEELGDEAVAYV